MFTVVECEPREAYEIYLNIPEFEVKYPFSTWEQRLRDRKFLCLMAMAGQLPIGFKIGYLEEEWFYSWIGGVVHEWRRSGIAKMLSDEQEEILRERGIKRVRMKTRNRFKPMLLFALSSGFDIVDTLSDPENPDEDDVQIVLEKFL